MSKLSSVEKEALELRHRRCRERHECDRIKAILLSDEGWSATMIAQALRLHESSIVRHVEEYQSEKKLTIDSGGSQSLLSEAQTRALVVHLTEHIYYQTSHFVEHIKQRYGVEYSIPGLNKWLHAHGFSYKKPKGFPHKGDPAKQHAFVAAYQVLKATLPENEPILFGDAVHPTQATKITAGWIRTGREKPIATTGSRTRLNIMGAIELGRLSRAVVRQYDTINSDSIQRFLRELRMAYREYGTLHLILDGAGYHRSQRVLEEAQALNIQLHPLPPYSPNSSALQSEFKSHRTIMESHEQIRQKWKVFSNGSEIQRRN